MAVANAKLSCTHIFHLPSTYVVSDKTFSSLLGLWLFHHRIHLGYHFDYKFVIYEFEFHNNFVNFFLTYRIIGIYHS